MADRAGEDRDPAAGRLAEKVTRLPDWPLVKDLLARLNQAGFGAWLVGGAVRDLMLDRVPGDADILTTAGPDRIRDLFRDRRVRQVGKSFAVSLVDGVEVACCRSGAGADNCLRDDLALRDLTVNSMALDPLTGHLTDPFGGREDIQDRVVRFTLDPLARITEDPLRMVRACRFAAQAGWRLAPDTAHALAACSPLLADQAAPERRQSELLKAMALDRPSRFFILLHQAGLLAVILPCLDRCHGLDGGPNHGETVFEHCMMVGDALSPGRPLLRLAGFVHDTGKFDAAEMKEGGLSFHGHETRDAALARDLDTLRFSIRDKTRILSLVRSHMRPLTAESTPRAVRRLLAMLEERQVDWRDFMRLRIADKKSNRAKPPYTLADLKVRLGKLRAELTPDAVLTPDRLALDGKAICRLLDLGPGPRVGQIKQHLFEQVLKDPCLNTPEHLARLAREVAP